MPEARHIIAWGVSPIQAGVIYQAPEEWQIIVPPGHRDCLPGWVVLCHPSGAEMGINLVRGLHPGQWVVAPPELLELSLGAGGIVPPLQGWIMPIHQYPGLMPGAIICRPFRAVFIPAWVGMHDQFIPYHFLVPALPQCWMQDTSYHWVSAPFGQIETIKL